MAATPNTDEALLAAAAAMLQQSPQTLAAQAPQWPAVVKDSNQDAWQQIQAGLGGRGFTPGQVLAWDGLAQFHRDLALFWAFTRAGALSAANMDAVEKLDRRKELATVTVTAGGLPLIPGVVVPVTIGGGTIAGGSFGGPDFAVEGSACCGGAGAGTNPAVPWPAYACCRVVVRSCAPIFRL